MAEKKMTLAEGLLLRKHLVQKVEQLRPIKVNGDQGLFELQTKRQKITDEVDELKIQVPKVSLDDVTKTFDTYSKSLRQLDAAIQKANWETTLDFDLSDDVKV